MKSKLTITSFITLLIISIWCLIIIATGNNLPGLSNGNSNNIKIAAQNMTESEIIAQIDKQMIEHYTNYHVTIIPNLGSGVVTYNAQRHHMADMSATRYMATDQETVLHYPYRKGQTTKNIYHHLKKQFAKKGIDYLPSYGFADTYCWMITQKTSKQKNIKTISQLKPYANSLKAGIDPMWENMKGDGYKNFKKTYFSFGSIYPMQAGLVYQALAHNKLDIGLGYSTDGRIKDYNLKILKDNKNFFPPFECSPAINFSTLHKYPKLKNVILKLRNKISLKQMQYMNSQVDSHFKSTKTVAHNFLIKNNYFK